MAVRPEAERSSFNFWALFAAASTSNLGDGLIKAALPLLAVRFTRSPALVAAVTLLNTLPSLLVSLPAGAMIDRLDRRRVMVAVNLVRAAVLAGFAISAALGAATLFMLYAVALLLGCCETVSDLASTSLVPAVVAPDRLEWANTRLMGAESLLNEFVGPPLAGALVGLGTALPASATSAAYLAAGLALLLVTGVFRIARTRRTTIRADIVEGLRYVWRQHVQRTLSLLVAVMAASWSAWTAVLVLYVVRPGPVGLSSFGYGVLLSLLAVGGLAGTVAAVPVRRRVGRQGVIALDVFATMTMLATPAATSNLWAIGAATLVGGIGSGMWNVMVVSLRQSITPAHLLGRTSSVGRLLGWGTMPLGAGLAGVIAQATDVRVVFAVGAAATAVLFLPVVRSLSEDALAAAERLARSSFSEPPASA
jgi:MFS family permease